MKAYHSGFTLLEVLLAVAMIGVLAGIVISAVNPVRQLADARDAQRRNDVEAIANAIVQYEVKNGSLPPGIDGRTGPLECSEGDSGFESKFGICRYGSIECPGSHLDALIPNYLANYPDDPLTHTDLFTGYIVYHPDTDPGIFAVCAPFTESGPLIYKNF